MDGFDGNGDRSGSKSTPFCDMREYADTDIVGIAWRCSMYRQSSFPHDSLDKHFSKQ